MLRAPVVGTNGRDEHSLRLPCYFISMDYVSITFIFIVIIVIESLKEIGYITRDRAIK